MEFNAKQIFSAVLNEYEHGEDFSLVENICIHVLLIFNYLEKFKNEVKIELGNEYIKFVADLNNVRSNK